MLPLFLSHGVGKYPDFKTCQQSNRILYMREKKKNHLTLEELQKIKDLFALGELKKALKGFCGTILENDSIPIQSTFSLIEERQIKGDFHVGEYQIELNRIGSQISKLLEKGDRLAMATHYFERGKENEQQLKKDTAIANYTKAIELNPVYGEAYLRYGVAIGISEPEKAILNLSKALELDPTNPEAYFERGCIFQRNFSMELEERTQKAILDFSKAIELDPVYHKAYLERGETYRFLKKFEKALKDMDKAIELAPAFSEYYMYRGLYFYDMKIYQKALADINQFMRLNIFPFQNSFAFELRGRTYEKLGDTAKAQLDFKKAKEWKDRFGSVLFFRYNRDLYSFFNS